MYIYSYVQANVCVQLYVKQFILVLLFINYYIVFHMNNCRPPFAPVLYIYKTYILTDRNQRQIWTLYTDIHNN